jgi:hypothetical protein
MTGVIDQQNSHLGDSGDRASAEHLTTYANSLLENSPSPELLLYTIFSDRGSTSYHQTRCEWEHIRRRNCVTPARYAFTAIALSDQQPASHERNIHV